MSNLDDINKLMKDMMGNFPFDTVGVEKTFLLHSPLVPEVAVLKRGIVRRAKLHYFS